MHFSSFLFCFVGSFCRVIMSLKWKRMSFVWYNVNWRRWAVNLGNHVEAPPGVPVSIQQ